MQKNRIVLDWKYFRVFEYKSEMSEEIPAGICDNKVIGSKGAAKAETVPRSQRRRTQFACICSVMLRRFPLKPVGIAAGNESLWHIGVASASKPMRPGKPASALTATWRKRIVDYHAQARMYVCMKPHIFLAFPIRTGSRPFSEWAAIAFCGPRMGCKAGREVLCGNLMVK